MAQEVESYGDFTHCNSVGSLLVRGKHTAVACYTGQAERFHQDVSFDRCSRVFGLQVVEPLLYPVPANHSMAGSPERTVPHVSCNAGALQERLWQIGSAWDNQD